MTQIPDEPSTELEPYKTSDTPFAAFLHYHDHKICGTKQDPNDYKREVIVFIYSDEIPELEKEWRFGAPVGDLKRYHRSLKIATRFVNEGRKKREN